MMKECKKANVEYKKAAIESVSKILEVYESDKFGVFFTEHLKPLLEEEEVKEKKTEDDEEKTAKEENNKNRMQMRLASLSALSLSWPKTKYDIQKQYLDEIVVILSQLHLKGVYKIKIEVILTLSSIIKRYLLHDIC